jgi:integral membrane protein
MRLISFVEGTSFLLLLGIAMPLKHLADMPEAVSVIGMIHGILFLIYVIAAAYLMLERRWSFWWFMGAMMASVVPFGMFALDVQLRRHKDHDKKCVVP